MGYKMRIYFLILSLLFIITPSLHAASSKYVVPVFKSHVSPIPDATQKIMRQYTWRENCPVPLSDLAEVTLSYWGFDHKPHQGVLIVDKTLANEVVDIFKAAYYHQFPIERMELVEQFQGDDNAAMAVNDTSAFNCRAVTGKPGIFSQHSYGRAIDINTLINPYVKGDKILPPGGKPYVDRLVYAPGKITKDSVIYKEFTKRGWEWGGNLHDLQDYQHFQKRAEDEKRKANGDGT